MVDLDLISHVFFFFQIISQGMGDFQYQSLFLPASNSFPQFYEFAANRNLRNTMFPIANQYAKLVINLLNFEAFCSNFSLIFLPVLSAIIEVQSMSSCETHVVVIYPKRKNPSKWKLEYWVVKFLDL